MTWRENYARADAELGLEGERSCEWYADNALDPEIAAMVLFEGMNAGWFRSSNGTPNSLSKYFNDEDDDPYQARESINGDKHIVPDWSDGQSIGSLISDYYFGFLRALEAASRPSRGDA